MGRLEGISVYIFWVHMQVSLAVICALEMGNYLRQESNHAKDFIFFIFRSNVFDLFVKGRKKRIGGDRYSQRVKGGRNDNEVLTTLFANPGFPAARGCLWR